MMKYLSNGDFFGLDSFLAEQMSLYKDVEGDEGQDRDDWQSRFELLRADEDGVAPEQASEQPHTQRRAG